jgi:hypothetical protein
MDEHAQAAVGTRIVGRTLAAVWRQKQAIAAGVVILAALGGYWVLGPSRAVPSDPTAGLGSGDCADTAIAALANRTPDTLQQAYQCMDLSYRQRVNEQQFTSQVKAAGSAPVTKVERVGSHPEPNGSELVYFALDSGDQSVGYIVYLGANGKVLKIE